jgi:hypothetical protein
MEDFGISMTDMDLRQDMENRGIMTKGIDPRENDEI